MKFHNGENHSILAFAETLKGHIFHCLSSELKPFQIDKNWFYILGLPERKLLSSLWNMFWSIVSSFFTVSKFILQLKLVLFVQFLVEVTNN